MWTPRCHITAIVERITSKGTAPEMSTGVSEKMGVREVIHIQNENYLQDAPRKIIISGKYDNPGAGGARMPRPVA